MSRVPSRVRNYIEMENDEVAWITYIPNYYGKGPAKFNLTFDSPKALYGNPADIQWRLPCEKLGEEEWQDKTRSTEEVRTCGCSYCQIGFDVILRWRITR